MHTLFNLETRKYWDPVCKNIENESKANNPPCCSDNNLLFLQRPPESKLYNSTDVAHDKTVVPQCACQIHEFMSADDFVRHYIHFAHWHTNCSAAVLLCATCAATAQVRP